MYITLVCCFIQFTFYFYGRLSVHEISLLEDNSPIVSADIFIAPPEDVDCNDENSGDEDEGEISKLSRRQLLAETQIWYKIPSAEGVLEIVEGNPDENDQPLASTSRAGEPPIKKSKTTKVNRKWKQIDHPLYT